MSSSRPSAENTGPAHPKVLRSELVPVRPENQPQELASPEAVAAFQASFLRLLERRTALYTMGDSSSVPTHTAIELVRSICFVLGIDPETREIPERLLSADLEDEFRRRLDEIAEKIARTRELWRQAVAEMPLIRNVALRDTLENIGAFFECYDHRSMAHEIPCSIDYPLCHWTPTSLLGVDYIAEYLRRLLIEIGFLARFDLETTIRLLASSCPDYRGLLISLYEPVATNAVGRALVGEDPRALDITAENRAAIASRLAPLDARGRAKALCEAAEVACASLGIEDAEAIAYLRDLTPELLPRIEVCLAQGDLSGVFLSI